MNLYDCEVSNVAEVGLRILLHEKIMIDKEVFYHKLYTYPYPDSLLSLVDVLIDYHISSQPYNIQDIGLMEKVKSPFVVQIKKMIAHILGLFII